MEFDAKTSSSIVWDLSEGISVLDVVVRQWLVIFELSSIEDECLLIGTAVFNNLCLQGLDCVAGLAADFVFIPILGLNRDSHEVSINYKL